MKKREKAVAISYDKSEIAPKVVASGKGIIAEKIMEKASEKKIPIHKDEKLVEELLKIDVGFHISPELYEAVAQILVFISDLDNLGKIK